MPASSSPFESSYPVDTDIIPLLFNERLQDYFTEKDESPFSRTFYSPLKKTPCVCFFKAIELKRRILQYQAKY